MKERIHSTKFSLYHEDLRKDRNKPRITSQHEYYRVLLLPSLQFSYSPPYSFTSARLYISHGMIHIHKREGGRKGKTYIKRIYTTCSLVSGDVQGMRAELKQGRMRQEQEEGRGEEGDIQVQHSNKTQRKPRRTQRPCVEVHLKFK